MDIKQKLAELRAKKLLETQNAKTQKEEVSPAELAVPVVVNSVQNNNDQDKEVHQAELSQDIQSTNESQGNSSITVTTTVTTIGTAKTSEIDHLTFMSQMTELKDAIHNKHPRMPVLLMMIHKHVRHDPELVTTLAEEEIGTIVEGLKIQTKTELVGTVEKKVSAKKKVKLDVSML